MSKGNSNEVIGTGTGQSTRKDVDDIINDEDDLE
jgi:hypothetical protein